MWQDIALNSLHESMERGDAPQNQPSDGLYLSPNSFTSGHSPPFAFPRRYRASIRLTSRRLPSSLMLVALLILRHSSAGRSGFRQNSTSVFEPEIEMLVNGAGGFTSLLSAGFKSAFDFTLNNPASLNKSE